MFRLRSIDYIRNKIKAWSAFLDRKDIYAASIVVFVGISSYFLGRVATIEEKRPPVRIEQYDALGSDPLVGKEVKTAVPYLGKPEFSDPISQTAAAVSSHRPYVGSKTSKKYHLTSCPSAQKISASNRVYFSTKAEAEQAGYVPAGNCKGI